MPKLRKFKRDLPLWKKTQLQERKRRRMMRDRMMFGMPMSKGTPNQIYTVPRKPAARPSFFARLFALLPWVLMRRKRDKERR